MRILGVGSGLIGLTSAYFLRRAGHEGTVLELIEIARCAELGAYGSSHREGSIGSQKADKGQSLTSPVWATSAMSGRGGVTTRL